MDNTRSYESRITDERTDQMDHDDIVILNRDIIDPLTARTYCELFVTVDGEYKDFGYWMGLPDDEVVEIYSEMAGL